ncbi:gamma-glutamyl-gamma-aminobutyrate hydrolase family protein [Celerinatantimonas sp. YJH-8]|uniref:gamma-glutamyl-gamma-aminobutyrate hydrolase family protein n=1 Tax=Celerinatantimonas sp. YJH-8 TaxID=3228714 RepID=UPI0038C907DE
MATTRHHTPRPIIGVTGNSQRFAPSWYCLKLVLSLCGAKAKRISLRHHVNINELDGLIISGGHDIHPSLYGMQPYTKTRYDQARDELEQRYIRYAYEHRLPVLGICRGYQLINVVYGGSLYHDIRSLRRHTSNTNTVFPQKKAFIQPSSQLHQLVKKHHLRINSLHHQAILDLAPQFVAVAHDRDQFIQAIESIQQQAIIGVQWHPEYLFYQRQQRELFRWLIHAAQTRKAPPL